MKTNKNIGASAFLVNELRSQNEELCRDPYAKLWVTKETEDICKIYSEKVYAIDDIVLGIRNRFFLDQISHATSNDMVIINLGCGFTNYPFLLPKSYPFYEVDLPHIVDFKQEQVNSWMEKGNLPKREINFISCDLNDEENRLGLKKFIQNKISDKKTLVVMEGLTYYLNKSSFYQVIDMCRDIQIPGSKITFDYWRDDSDKNPTIRRFQKFLKENLKYDNHSYNYLTLKEIETLDGYELKLNTDVIEQEVTYRDRGELKENEVVFDLYAVVERK